MLDSVHVEPVSRFCFATARQLAGPGARKIGPRNPLPAALRTATERGAAE